MKMQNKGPEPFPFLKHEAKLKKPTLFWLEHILAC